MSLEAVTSGSMGLAHDLQAPPCLGLLWFLFPLNKSLGAESLSLLGEKDAEPADKPGLQTE